MVAQTSLLGQVGRDVAGALTPEQQDPSEVLFNVQISQSKPLMEHLEPPLNNLGFTLQPASVKFLDVLDRVYTLAVKGDVQRALIYIPRWILDNPSRKNLSAVFSLPFGFERGKTLFIFSDAGLDEPDWLYLGILEEKWPNKLGIKASFIGWRHVQSLKKAETQEYRLKGMLKLGTVPSATPAAPKIGDMTVEEKRELAQILAGLADFSTPRDRKGLIHLAGLGEILSNFDFTGKPRTVAGELVGRLQYYGEMPDRPGCHALGMLIDYLRSLPDLPRDAQQTLEELITTYRLMS